MIYYSVKTIILFIKILLQLIKSFLQFIKALLQVVLELLTTCDKFMKAMVLGLGFSMILLQELESCCRFVKKNLWFIKVLSQLVSLKFCCNFLKFCYNLAKLITLL